MSRVIHLETAGKERKQLTRTIVLAIRELMRQTEPDMHTRNLAAFIALALEEIAATIDASVGAWEKRGYWVKAERFRMEWEWTQRLGGNMRKAVLAEDWAAVALISSQVAVKLQKVQVPQRHRLGTPWEGAWDLLQASSKPQKLNP